MVKNNQNFVKKTFLLLKYQKLLIFLVKNLLKKLSYFSRCFYMESPICLLLVTQTRGQLPTGCQWDNLILQWKNYLNGNCMFRNHQYFIFLRQKPSILAYYALYPILDTRIYVCPSSFVMFVLRPLKSETGWTGELWWNRVLLILEN